MPQELSRLFRVLTTVTALAVLAACGGGGGSVGGNPPSGGNPPGNGGERVTVSGKITFDRLVFQSTVGDGLNSTPVVSPAREVIVEAIAGSSTYSTTTDANGDYSLSVPANTSMYIQARARMEKTGAAPTWTFTVRNNFNGDAAYALRGSTFNSGATNSTRDLHAPISSTGSDDRPAAPFAILDTVYQAKELIRGAAPDVQFAELNLFWSTENRDNVDQFCPDQGDINTSFYTRNYGADDCGQAVPDGIYILGFNPSGNGDTDEFDQHVIAHEFGHYFEDRFSRSDSIGGSHSVGDRLDLRVAFGEGWGNAFGAMALNDPQYRDSFSGISDDSGFNLETGAGAGNATGWYSEASVGKILWDVFDTTTEVGDTVTLGFTPIYDVMTGAQVETDALTSIYSFASALRSENGGQAGAIATLLNREDIESTPDDFGAGESNDGGDSRALPVYDEIQLNSPKTGVCSSSVAGSKDPGEDVIPNKLGNHRFFRFVNDVSRLVTITAQGATPTVGTVLASDPEIYLFQRGDVVLSGTSTTDNLETIDQQPLAAGTYILDVFDYDTSDVNQPPRCMTVSITGS